MKEVIQNIIQGLVLKQLGEDDTLISSGLIDSVIIIELILEIEQKLELIVDLSEVTEQNFDSINKLHQFLLRKSQLQMFFCFKKRSFLSLEKEGDKLAVSGSDIDVSWSELKQKVDHQVIQLHKKTNGLTVPVILYGHKEADFIVLILACLILEIPFVPIDISYPEKRIDKVKQQLKKGLLVDVASGLITLFGKGEVCSQKNQNDPLTYVIFTSGSTGDPKGLSLIHI